MKIETLVKITNSKDNTDLYSLFCRAAKGEYIETTKKSHTSSDIAHLESSLNKAFDSFAQDMFDQGVKYEREATK